MNNTINRKRIFENPVAAEEIYKGNLDKWIEDKLDEIPSPTKKKLCSEYDYRYVNDFYENFQNEWVINEYSQEVNNENCFFDEKRKNFFLKNFQHYEEGHVFKRNSSFSFTDEIKENFKWRVEGSTERICQLVNRMSYLMEKFALKLEPEERKLLLAILYDINLVEPVIIEHLSNKVLNSEYYNDGDKVAESLFNKINDADYHELLATVEMLRR